MTKPFTVGADDPELAEEVLAARREAKIDRLLRKFLDVPPPEPPDEKDEEGD